MIHWSILSKKLEREHGRYSEEIETLREFLLFIHASSKLFFLVFNLKLLSTLLIIEEDERVTRIKFRTVWVEDMFQGIEAYIGPS